MRGSAAPVLHGGTGLDRSLLRDADPYDRAPWPIHRVKGDAILGHAWDEAAGCGGHGCHMQILSDHLVVVNRAEGEGVSSEFVSPEAGRIPRAKNLSFWAPLPGTPRPPRTTLPTLRVTLS